MQKLAGNAGVTVTYYPSGPLLEYLPARCRTPPTTRGRAARLGQGQPREVPVRPAGELRPGPDVPDGPALHPRRLEPQGPDNGWAKTWAYLKELGKYVDYYPSGTTETMKNLPTAPRHRSSARPAGTSTRGCSARCPRRPRSPRSRASTGSPTRTTPSCPRACRPTQQAAVLALLAFMLTPEQQAKAYDEGYFYPGPAIKEVELSIGAAEEPGRDPGVRPPRVRRADRRTTRPRSRSTRRAWWRRSTRGTARSAAAKVKQG